MSANILKAIIVDDENWICQLIAKIVDWEKLGIEMAGIAEDGIKAFDLIRSLKPDIVITDIKMPGMDGLDIIKNTREIGFETSFVIISGFKHFEYAHTAIKYGVEDYLLKPIKKQEITNVLSKIATKLYEKKTNKKEKEQLHDKIEQSKNRLRLSFLDKMFKGAEDDEILKVEKANSEYGFKFEQGLFNCIVFNFDVVESELISENYRLVCIGKLHEIVYMYFQNVCFDFQIFEDYVCLINYANKNSDDIQIAIKSIFNALSIFLGIANVFSLTIGIGQEASSLKGLYNSKKTSEDAIKCRITVGINRIINYPLLKLESYKINTILNEEKERKFINIIEAFDFGGIKHFVLNFFIEIAKNASINPLVYFDISERLNRVFKATINGMNSNLKFQDDDKPDLYACTTVKEYSKLLSLYFEEKLKYFKDIVKTQTYAPVRFAKNYISENYRETIKLDDIAKLINLNPVYLSIIFKKETGVNFTDYIINYRIKIAKDLLKDIRYNVSQVSERVGYSDPKYFSKLFKKHVGINPIDYRKIHL